MSRSSSPTSCLNLSAPSPRSCAYIHYIQNHPPALHWPGCAYLLPGSRLPGEECDWTSLWTAMVVPRTLGLLKPRYPWFSLLLHRTTMTPRSGLTGRWARQAL